MKANQVSQIYSPHACENGFLVSLGFLITGLSDQLLLFSRLQHLG